MQEVQPFSENKTVWLQITRHVLLQFANNVIICFRGTARREVLTSSQNYITIYTAIIYTKDNNSIYSSKLLITTMITIIIIVIIIILQQFKLQSLSKFVIRND